MITAIYIRTILLCEIGSSSHIASQVQGDEMMMMVKIHLFNHMKVFLQVHDGR